jgi:hypothetical protein
MLMACLLVLVNAHAASAQTETATDPPAEVPAQALPPAPARNPDRAVNRAQPDFALAALPTTLRVPRHKSAFRVTHRFGRPLGAGDFGDLVGDLFGLDAGALIGLEYRFGLFRGAQVGIHRTSGKTIQFFGQYSVRQQRDGFPVGIAIMGSAEGENNYRGDYAPGLGLLLSRELGDRGAIYVEPFWINNANRPPRELAGDDDTVFIGLGTRVRIRPTVYLLLEGAPRLAGHDPGVSHVSFGIEKRSGGHTFQLNVSNSFATTLAQVARGGFNGDDWYLGFNISRKFF